MKRFTKEQKIEIVEYFKTHTERQTGLKFNMDSVRAVYRWKKDPELNGEKLILNATLVVEGNLSEEAIKKFIEVYKESGKIKGVKWEN